MDNLSYWISKKIGRFVDIRLENIDGKLIYYITVGCVKDDEVVEFTEKVVNMIFFDWSIQNILNKANKLNY